VRCAECQTYPLTPGHYCECCGRKLSLEERKAQETAPIVTASPAVAPVEARPPTPPVVPEMAQASNGAPEVPKATAARIERVQPARAPKPAVVSKRPIVPVPSPRRTRSMVLAFVAVVMVAAVGVAAVGVAAVGVPEAARWLGIPQMARESQPEQPTAAADAVTTVAERRETPEPTLSPVETTAKRREPAPAPPRAAAQPKPTTSARLPSDQPNPSGRPDPSSPTPALQARAPADAPPPAAPVAEPRRSIAREAPVGRFFEPNDVDQSPQVATRVEPRLPGDLVRPLNDIVVVRVLVSQTGHPYRINLLRRSKTGRSLDDAVVAAVTEWTFSPARRRGEAVSCWYNIGVPLGRAD
jgi:periplasmic protein TonB